MFCIYCGAKVADDARFCGSCGAKLPYQEEAAKALETPVTETPVIEMPVVEEPVIETPVVEVPVIETPAVEEPAIETPTALESVVERPVMEEPVIEPPVIEEPVIDAPTIDESVFDAPSIDEEAIAAEAAKNLTEATVEEPVPEVPVVSTPTVEEPMTETPVIEEPVIETPVIENPNPVIENPTPVIQNPTPVTPVIETPVTPVAQTPAPKNIPSQITPIAPVQVPEKTKKKKKKHTVLKVFLILLLILVVAYGVLCTLLTLDVIDLNLPENVSKFIDFDYLVDKAKSDALPEDEEKEFLGFTAYWDEACVTCKERKFRHAFPEYAEDYILDSYNASDVETLLEAMYKTYFEELGDDIECTETCEIEKKITGDDALEDLSEAIEKQTGESIEVTKAYVISNTTKAVGSDGTKTYTDSFLFYQADDEWAVIPLVGDNGLNDFNLD